MNFYSETVPCLVLAALGSEAGRCLPRLCLLRAPFEECKTHLLSGHNISASVGLGEIEAMRKYVLILFTLSIISAYSLYLFVNLVTRTMHQKRSTSNVTYLHCFNIIIANKCL